MKTFQLHPATSTEILTMFNADAAGAVVITLDMERGQFALDIVPASGLPDGVDPVRVALDHAQRAAGLRIVLAGEAPRSGE